MPLKTITVRASEVLSIDLKPEGRAGVWFLDWKVRDKPMDSRGPDDSSSCFQGAGIYGLCFDDRLIYVGSYLGKGKSGAFTAGDVVASRWWTHIAAITARGDRLHLSKTSLRALQGDPGPSHPMVAGFMAASQPESLHKDQGNLAPLRRLRFALQHDHVFLGKHVNPEEVLTRFTFTYVRFDAKPLRLSPLQWKQRIEAAEHRLIKRLAPACNATHVTKDTPAADIACDAVSSLVEAELRVMQP